MHTVGRSERGQWRAGRALLAVALLVGTALVVVTADPGAPEAGAVEQKVAVSVADTGSGACAATLAAEVWCWGGDWDGKLGNGSGGLSSYVSNPVSTPVKAQVSGGGIEVADACARSASGAVQCWGYTGIIEDGEGSRFSNPVWGSNTPKGYGHGSSAEISGRCARHLDGTVSCQGWDNWGQLGSGGAGWPALGYPNPPPSSSTAKAVSGLSNAVSLSSNNNTACAVRSNGTLWCWGWGNGGALGDGDSSFETYPCNGDQQCRDSRYSSTPKQVVGVTDAVSVHDSCVRRAAGKVSCWGLNSSGRFDLTAGTSTILTPTEIPWLAGAVDIEMGSSAVCAAFPDGHATCQGTGPFGNGTRATQPTRSEVDRHGDVVQMINVATSSWCARYSDGRIDCWGDNYSGQLGLGYRSDQAVLTPSPVVGFGGDVDVLDGALFEVGSGGNIIKEGESFTLRLRVENLSDGPLSNVAVVSTAVTATDEEALGLATIDAQPGGEALSGTLGVEADGEHLDFADFSVTGQRAGTVELAVTVTATDGTGARTEETYTYDLTVEPAPVLVELLAHAEGTPAPAAPAPFEYILNENEHENRFVVDVRITNRTEDEDVESLDFLDPEAPVDFDSLLVDEEGLPIPGVSITPLTDPLPAFEDVTLGPGESRTLTYLFEGFDEAHAEVSAIVQGRLGDAAVSGRGTTTVKVLTNVLVEFGMQDTRGGSYQGGQSLRFSGVLENVSEDALVGVVVFPTTDGNAGNGNVFRADAGGETPVAPIGFMLGPDQRVDLSALVTTTELAVASDATVSWEVRAWKHTLDEETGVTVKAAVPDTQIRLLDSDGFDDSFTVRLPPTAALPEVVGECAYAYFGCGVLVGLERLADGLYDLGRLAGNLLIDIGNQELMLISWAGQMLGEVAQAVLGDPAARQFLIDEISNDFAALVETGFVTYLQAAELASVVGAGIDQFLQTWDQIYRTGDLERVQFELGRIAGENPDLALQALVASKAAVLALKDIATTSSPIRTALTRRAAARESTLGPRLAAAEDAARAGGKLVTESGELDAGTLLTKGLQGEYWAADPRDIDTLGAIATAEQVTLTYGSRLARSAELIRTGAAWPTPRELNITPIDRIDIDYLGYPAAREGYADLASPPVDLVPPPGGGRFADYTSAFVNGTGDCCFHPGDDRLAELARAWVARTHPGLDAPTAQRVAARVQTRADEFIANYERYIDFNLEGRGLASGTEAGALDVAIGRVSPMEYLAGGPEAWRQVFDERVVRLTPFAEGEFGQVVPNWLTGVNLPERLYWEVSFDPFGTGDFRPTTGGVELLSMQKLDGSPIYDEVKRARVYDELKAAINMTNGELDDFVKGAPSETLARYAEGGDAAVTVGPGGDAYVTYFRERASLRPGTPNAGLLPADGTGQYLFLAGHPAHWRAPTVTGIPTLVLQSVYTKLKGYWQLPQLYLPRYLAFLLAPDAVPNAYDGEGENIRGTEDGGLEQYDPDGGGAGEGAGLLTMATAATAGAWVPISVEDALALGADPDVLEISPMATVSYATAGDTELGISSPEQMGLDADTAWFRPGDVILIDPGGPNEERATVATLGSLVLTAPLERSHSPGEMVIRDLERSGPVDPTPTTTTTTTTPSGPSGGGPGGGQVGGPDGGALPRTGIGLGLAALAVALILTGLVLSAPSRRRRARGAEG